MRELTVSRPVFILLTAFFCAALSIIYLPILVMIIFSFNSGRYQTLPFREPTFEWYVNLVADSSFVDSFFYKSVYGVAGEYSSNRFRFLGCLRL